MKTKFNGILTLLLAFTVHFTFAQKSISGTVSDDSGPLPGVSVLIKGTSTGVETDFDGKYTIQTNEGDVLQYSYVGMETAFATVGSGNLLNIELKASSENILEEVVVVAAYDFKRTKPKSNIAVSSVDAGTIEARPNASFIQTLQGQVAGLSINTSSGQPGANSETLIRGVGSLSGNTEPLFIIDGMPVDEDNFRSLNPNEIASISVLKDAGATAIYGNRGANGAVVITTRRGKFNSDMKINYTGTTSFQRLQNHNYDLMNAKEQLLLEREYGVGQGNGMSDEEIKEMSYLKDTDWTKVFFRTGISQDHTLSLTSGGANMNSYTSFGFFDQQGVLVDSRLKRFNLRNNLTAKTKNDRLNLSTTISLNNSNNDSPNQIGSGAINRNYALGGMISVPYISPDDYTPDEGGSIPVVFSNTPLFLLDRLDTYTRYENEVKALAGVNLSYKLTDNIKYSVKLNTDYTEVQLTRAESPTSFNAIYFAEEGNDTPGFQSQSSDRVFTYNVVNQLSFEKTFNEKHNLMVSLFSEYFKAHRRFLGYFQEGLDPRVFFPGDGSAFISDNPDNDWFVDTPSSTWTDAGLLSYFGMLDYDFNSKYGLSSTLRRDASYRFRESNRWATFYSFSGRWNISEEKFMDDSVFQLLKLRASYGTTGNQRIDNVEGRTAPFAIPNGFLDLYQIGSGYGGQNSIYASQLGTSDLKWETISQTNIGLDFESFSKRLRGNVDVYNKVTTDLFEEMDVPYTSGTDALYINGAGELVNKGIELSLFGDVIKQADGVNLVLRFVGNYNKVNRFGSEESDVEDGGKLYQYYRYRYIGVNPLNGNLLFLDADDNVTENPDQDLDRVFTDKNRYPDYQGSFGFDFDYKNFFISTTFNYAIGIDRFDWNYQGFHDPDAIGQFRHSNEIMNYWTPENRETNIPSLDASNYSLWGGSDMYLFSGDYVRLRHFSIGYNVKEKKLEEIGFKSIKTFINAENYLTFTKWKGFDVESASGSSQWGYPTPRILSLGIELGF